MDERLALLEAALLRLRQTAMGNIVLVEGRRDAAALETLGVGGEHVQVHQGRPLQTVIDELALAAGGRTVIVLMDWDRTGGRLQDRVHRGLAGRVAMDTECRRLLGSSSHATALEDVPADLDALRGRATLK